MAIPELLAPAGDFERLEAAVLYGADAVYLGGKQFGMRASPANFGPEQLYEAVRYCHGRNVRVYLTCNTLPSNSEIEELEGFIRHAAASGVDALIVADIGVLRLAKRTAPDLDIHISTQMGVVNYLAAGELYGMGAKRVVLVRELSLEDIRVIRERTPPELELEAFVHGAMCVSFSGRCLLSQYLTGRDANRGQCAQPCRWSYHLVEEKRPGEFYPVFEDEQGTHILNAGDLSMLPHIDRLAQAGIGSFKLEGRAKSAYYVATVTNAYRMAIDLYQQDPMHYSPPDWLLEETEKISHRRYTTGFYFPEEPPGQHYESDGYVQRWDVAAVVEGWKDGRLFCEQRNRFFAGDALEALIPGEKPYSFTVSGLWDGEGAPIQTANHAAMKLQLQCDRPIPPGSMLRRGRSPFHAPVSCDGPNPAPGS